MASIIITAIVGIFIFRFYHKIFNVAYFSCQAFAMEIVAIIFISSLVSALICGMLGLPHFLG